MPDFIKTNHQESLWGDLYEPVKPKVNTGKGLRVVLFISCNCGNNVLQNLYQFEQKYPEKLNIIGVVTDDPVDPNAKISLKKRIWNFYTPEERSELLRKIISTCMNIGVPCYTGAVKTNYFRKMYESWNPDVLIMFCFGQKLDAYLYDFPPMGAYNLHPSDLPKQIGAGTQPFQNALRSGLKTSPLVIHRIAELIDMGPIVGVSSPVNIRLEDGSAPKSLLTLLEKITSPGGWMCVQLISEIIALQENGESKPVNWIEFDKLLPEDIKQLLMKPAINDLSEMYTVPAHPLVVK